MRTFFPPSFSRFSWEALRGLCGPICSACIAGSTMYPGGLRLFSDPSRPLKRLLLLALLQNMSLLCQIASPFCQEKNPLRNQMRNPSEDRLTHGPKGLLNVRWPRTSPSTPRISSLLRQSLLTPLPSSRTHPLLS